MSSPLVVFRMAEVVAATETAFVDVELSLVALPGI